MLKGLGHIRTIGVLVALSIAMLFSANAEARYGTQAASVATVDSGAAESQPGEPNYADLLREVEQLKAQNTKKNAELKLLRERIQALEAAHSQRDGVKPDAKDGNTPR